MQKIIEQNETHLIEALSWGYKGDLVAFLTDAYQAIADGEVSLGAEKTYKQEHEGKTVLIIARKYSTSFVEPQWECGSCGTQNPDEQEFCAGCGAHFAEKD